MGKYDFTNETPFNEQPLYRQGYEDAIDKAYEWLKARNVLTDASLEGFKKAMEEELCQKGNGERNMKHGLYLCKVRGLQFCDYAVLRYDSDGWWQYIKEYTGENVEGWCGCRLKVVKVIELIEEE